MSFSRMMEATDHVARLPDCPAASEGYSPQALKAVFDKGATLVKEFINQVLLQELEANGAGASAAERLGSAYVEGLAGITVHQQIRSLKEALDRVEAQGEEAILGQIPDGSLGENKLDEALIALLYEKNKRTLCHKVYDKKGVYSFQAPAAGRYRIRGVGAGGAGNLLCPQGSPTGSFDGMGGPSGAYAEVNLHLEKGAPVSISVGSGGVPVGHSVGQILSEVEYEGDYVANARYSAPGEDTEIHFSNEKRLLIHGGSDDPWGAKVQIYGAWEAAPITRRGRSYAEEKKRAGADSALGQGGGDGVNAGMGGGGQGGRLYWGEDGDRRVLETPSAGSDGAVIIDYLGGEE